MLDARVWHKSLDHMKVEGFIAILIHMDMLCITPKVLSIIKR